MSNDRIPLRPHPMLATLVAQPFHRPGWVYEEKYDGYRILAYKEGAKVTLLSRNGNDRTTTFASVAGSIAKLREACAMTRILAKFYFQPSHLPHRAERRTVYFKKLAFLLEWFVIQRTGIISMKQK